MTYESLIQKAEENDIEVFEEVMPESLKGLYCDGIIWINKNIETQNERACILAEEIGHAYTTYGDIIDQKNIVNIKQEKKAREWAYNYLLPLEKIFEAFEKGIQTQDELLDFLDVTESFLKETLIYYCSKYGEYKKYNGYILHFVPLYVIERR